ncbi:MAG TPA: hypothetical protein VFH43_10425, partial [Candidatus Kapabacteria bacterium]|nr:hypothetical protein [Candidatus Kapabacteria bacterium]
MRTRLTILIVLLAMLASCDSSGPTTHLVDNGQDSLRVISVTGDSLYGGEQFTICMSRSDLDSAKIQVFIHSTEFTIDSIIGACLYFTVPQGASSGVMRIYYNGDIISDEYDLTLFEMHIDDAINSFWGYDPREGTTGTLLTINTSFMPHRPSDLGVSIGDVELPIIERSAT